ncbi:MAG: hypothetical protein AB1744_03520 [Candidatus Zixiibacteriota bacterium]
MRTVISLICALVILTPGQLLAAKVTDITLFSQDGQTGARIVVEGGVRFTHQTEIAKDGKPYRVFVDVLSAIHHLPRKNFTNLPDCPVTRIRSAQYAVTPEKVVRVVFDMEAETVYRVESDDKSITIFFPDDKKRRFVSWSTRPVPTAPEPGPQVTSKPSQPVAAVPGDTKTEKSAAELNRAIDRDRLLSLSAEPPDPPEQTPPAPAPPAAKPTPEVAEPSPAPKKPVVVVDVPQGPVFDPALIEPEESKKTEKPVAQPKTTAQAPEPESKKNEVPPPTPRPSEKSAQFAASDVKPSEKAPSPAKASEPQPPAKVAVKPEPSPKVTKEADEQAAPASDKPVISSVVKPEAKPEAKQVQKPAASMPPTPAAKPDEKVDEKPAPSPAPKKTDTAPDTVADIKKDEGSRPTDTVREKKESDKKLPTSRFRRSPTRPTKIKGTLVAEFPKRLVIKYRQSGQRDPFESLISESRTYNSPIEGRIPNVEVIKLVGVLESESGFNVALFEDKDGYGYILREGDKVQNGYVLRVEAEKVYFQIFEYGWSRTMALNLDLD